MEARYSAVTPRATRTLYLAFLSFKVWADRVEVSGELITPTRVIYQDSLLFKFWANEVELSLLHPRAPRSLSSMHIVYALGKLNEVR